MYFFSRIWGNPDRIAPGRGAQSLGLFAGHAADLCSDGGDCFSELPAPRARSRPGWRVARSPLGNPVLLLGWIDNADELAQRLGLNNPTPESIYGAAVDRWGAEADSHIIGEYATLMTLPDGSIRMARSPWGSFPLFFHHGHAGFMACSILRPMFAAGLDNQIRPDAIERLLAFELPDGTTSQFEGIDMVRGGQIVIANRDGWSARTWYDPLDIREVRFKCDEDYVDATNALLTEAVQKALRLAKKPAMTLSGGLDSSIVCDEMLRQMPAGQKLTSITFVPLPEWDGRAVDGLFGDDGPYVREFIRTHPGLDPIFVDNRDHDFLSYSNEMFLGGDSGYPARVIGLVGLGVACAARDAGCDWLFSATMGNLTFSQEAPWAPAEFFRTLRWRQWWHTANNRLDDPRPIWRRMTAMGIMPNLPEGLRWKIRDLIHRGRPAELITNPYLDQSGPLAAKIKLRNTRSNISDLDFFTSRERFIRATYEAADIGSEAGLGSTQVFGVQMRDVLGYRPFIELCFGMPTEQFTRNGERRRLARRMGVGRLPEAQRTELRHGDHVVDWHARMTPMLPRLREEVRQIAEHPQLGALLDTKAMLRDLDNWPDAAPTDIGTVSRLRFALPAMAYVRRFVDFETGRNPQ